MLGLGGVGNSYPREGGFEIVAASEVMAILCLSRSLQELKQRLGNITVGYNHAREPIRAADLNAHGAMAVLLKEALKPNLVQTLENNLALVHGGPLRQYRPRLQLRDRHPHRIGAGRLPGDRGRVRSRSGRRENSWTSSAARPDSAPTW